MLLLDCFTDVKVLMVVSQSIKTAPTVSLAGECLVSEKLRVTLP